MGVTDHGGFGDVVMHDQGALHFGGADTMPGDVDDIVDAPGDPVVAIFVAASAIAGEVVAGVGFEVGVDHSLRVAVDAADLCRPAGFDRQHSAAGTFDFLAMLVQQHRLHAEHRLCRAARFDPLRADQRAEHDAAGLGLPPGIDDRAALFADDIEVPLPGFRVDRLTDCAEQSQAGAGRFLQWLRTFAHQRA
ncbi:hypothetical protein D3C76_956150 [compost metagenome]